jgi:hypothetical protein
LEVSAFVKKFEETFEVTAAAPVVTQTTGGPSVPAPEAAEEQSEFDVILEAAGDAAAAGSSWLPASVEPWRHRKTARDKPHAAHDQATPRPDQPEAPDQHADSGQFDDAGKDLAPMSS